MGVPPDVLGQTTFPDNSVTVPLNANNNGTDKNT